MTDHSFTVQHYARAAGILLLISVVAGGFGELYITGQLVVGRDPTATANNIRGSEFLFRLGFAAYLVEALCDLALIGIFYVLLRPVHQFMALFTIILGLASTITFAFTEYFYFTALVTANAPYLNSFSPEQIDAMVLHAMKISDTGAAIFMLFYGLAAIIRGYLILRSGYLPRIAGILWMIGGSCFVLRNFLFVLNPAHGFDLLLTPMLLAMLVLSFWLITKGVNVGKWNSQRSAM